MPNSKVRKDGTKRTHGEWATANGFRWFTEETLPDSWVDVASRKTKEFNKFLIKNKLLNALIISDTDTMKNINKSARNIKNVKLIKDEGANIYDLFKYKNVIITSSSAKKIQQRILNEKN